jgi:hypothetical protein
MHFATFDDRRVLLQLSLFVVLEGSFGPDHRIAVLVIFILVLLHLNP